jgi:hypothetical protein
VGNEAKCHYRIDGREGEGKALLETDELIVRGTERLRVPLRELNAVRASDGILSFTHNGRRVELELGDDAAKWHKRILHPRSVGEKLGLKDGMRLGLDGMDESELGSRAQVTFVQSSDSSNGSLDALFLRLRTARDLERIASGRTLLRPAGALWTLRTRGDDALSENDVRRAALTAGLVDVKVVRFSATETAEKFVIPKTSR